MPTNRQARLIQVLFGIQGSSKWVMRRIAGNITYLIGGLRIRVTSRWVDFGIAGAVAWNMGALSLLSKSP